MLAPETSILERLLDHAASLVGHLGDHLDDVFVGPLSDCVDAIANAPSEKIGDPRPIAAPAPSDNSVFIPGEVPERVSSTGDGR
jgi:hypothetical protein